MILRHNLRQLLLAPLHLLVSTLAYWFCWSLCEQAVFVIANRFEPWLSHAFLAKDLPIWASNFAWIVLAAASWEGWRLWSSGITELPGIFDELSPHCHRGPAAGSGHLHLAEARLDYAILLNLALCAPLQAFAAWQRLRNLIPWHDAARERFERWHRFAEERGGWHSEALYSPDPEALDWLILSGCLDHSPTKALVAFRKR